MTFQEKAYFASDRLTWVDFLVFDLLEDNRNFGKYDFGPGIALVDVLENFPKLTNFFEHMSRKPKLSSWLGSRKRPTYTLPKAVADSRKKP